MKNSLRKKFTIQDLNQKVLIITIIPLTIFMQIDRIGFNLQGNTEPLSEFDLLNAEFIGNWSFVVYNAVTYDSSKTLLFCSSISGIYMPDVADSSNSLKIFEKIHPQRCIYNLFYELTNQLLYVDAVKGSLEIWDVSDVVNSLKLGDYWNPCLVYDVYAFY